MTPGVSDGGGGDDGSGGSGGSGGCAGGGCASYKILGTRIAKHTLRLRYEFFILCNMHSVTHFLKFSFLHSHLEMI